MNDWEIELACVIGPRARNVAVAHALDHVAGYTVAIASPSPCCRR